MANLNVHEVQHYRSFEHFVLLADASGAPITGVDVTQIKLYVCEPGGISLVELTGTSGSPSSTERYAREIGQGLYRFDMKPTDTPYISQFLTIISVDITPGSVAQRQMDQYYVHSQLAIRASCSYKRSPSQLIVQTWLERDGTRVVDPTNLLDGQIYIYKASDTPITTFGPVGSDTRGVFVFQYSNPTPFNEGDAMMLRCRCQYPAGKTIESINGFEWAQVAA